MPRLNFDQPSDEQGQQPPNVEEVHKSVAATTGMLARIMNSPRASWNQMVPLPSPGVQRMRVEAETRQAAQETRDELIRQNEIMEQMLAEVRQARADANSWKGVAIVAVITLMGVVVAWLLSAVNATQFLSGLFHL